MSGSSSPSAGAGCGRARACIEDVTPRVDDGRFAAKRIVGDEVVVEADVFADGHDRVAAVVRWHREGEGRWTEVPMELVSSDRFRASFQPDRPGRYAFMVHAWIDRFGTWRDDLAKRVAAGHDVEVDLRIGAALVADAAQSVQGPDREQLTGYATRLEQPPETGVPDPRPELARSAELLALMRRHDPRCFATHSAPALPVVVDRERARFSSWYELFPRSWGPPGRHGTLRDVIGHLPYVASMGFDVLYLPPVHPIGTVHRKGPNNALWAGSDDPGSPWAVGSAAGGHEAIHPALGTLEDFEALRVAAHDHGLELALDIAFQAAPDHPWVTEHPQWFRHRPDGTIQPAENPPKLYQDIYPFDFESESWAELWDALAQVFELWIERGVQIFRVDNPHTKSMRFWEWCIDRIKARHPEVILLSEAFTRPRRMERLAKLGFSQSYTYFTWRNTAAELRQYFEALTRPPIAEFLRPNLWPATPDILPEFLQYGGRPAFVIRLVLAAMLGASYGIYGPAYELCEHRAVREDSEEYVDSEKYQRRRWDLGAERSLHDLVARLNQIRRDHPALQQDHTLRFCDTDNDRMLCFLKTDPPTGDVIVVVVSLDPHHAQAGWIHLPMPELVGTDEPVQMHDLLSEDRYLWSGSAHYVRLDPRALPAHVLLPRRRLRTEHDFDYFG